MHLSSAQAEDTFLRMDRAVHTDGEAVELLQGYEIPEAAPRELSQSKWSNKEALQTKIESCSS